MPIHISDNSNHIVTLTLSLHRFWDLASFPFKNAHLLPFSSQPHIWKCFICTASLNFVCKKFRYKVNYLCKKFSSKTYLLTRVHPLFTESRVDDNRIIDAYTYSIAVARQKLAPYITRLIILVNRYSKRIHRHFYILGYGFLKHKTHHFNVAFYL